MSGNRPHKALLRSSFQVCFIWGASVDASPELVRHFMTIYRDLIQRWIPSECKACRLAVPLKSSSIFSIGVLACLGPLE